MPLCFLRLQRFFLFHIAFAALDVHDVAVIFMYYNNEVKAHELEYL